MRHYVSPLVALALFATAACEPTDPADPIADAEATMAEANFLTSAEEADGWQLLFDGSTLNGWHNYGVDTVSSSWRVDGDALHFQPGGPGGDIVTAASYDDFELSLEWKIAECGNSGIFYRAQESESAIYWNAVEMQVLDNTCHPDAELVSHQAGSVYDLYAPAEDVTLPAGQWNHARVVARGTTVEHWLNGTKIAEYDTASEDWATKVAASKFAPYEGYGQNAGGVIGLQDHGDAVWYRNIKIRPLS